jgi:hypothetical protein
LQEVEVSGLFPMKYSTNAPQGRIYVVYNHAIQTENAGM